MWLILKLRHPQVMSVDTMALLESRLNCIPALDEQNFLLDEAVGWGEEWVSVTMES